MEKYRGQESVGRHVGYHARMNRVLAALCLLAALLATGCVAHEDTTDKDRQGGFYGGVSGGMTR